VDNVSKKSIVCVHESISHCRMPWVFHVAMVWLELQA